MDEGMRWSVSETLCLGSYSKGHKAAMVREVASRRVDVLIGSSFSVSGICDGMPSGRGVMDFTRVVSFSSDLRSFAIWQMMGRMRGRLVDDDFTVVGIEKA